MSPLSGSKRSIIALALTFFSGGSLLFAQEQSATALSQQVREIFERAAKAVVKIHGVDEHSEICGTGFFIDPTGTLYTAYTVGGEAGNSLSNLAARNIRRANFWQISAAGRRC
jgi:S1-C subfamily serine protease